MQVSSCKTLVALALAIGLLTQVAEGHMRMGYKVTKPRPSRPHKPRLIADPIEHNEGLA